MSRRFNLNTAKTNLTIHKHLILCIGKTLAQKIMDGLVVGPYSSLDDVQKRIKGIGFAKKTKLEEYGFYASSDLMQEEKDEKESKEPSLEEEKQDKKNKRDTTTSLRQPVASKAPATWIKRNNVDLYTLMTKEQLEAHVKEQKKRIDVDHLVEIQLLDHVYQQAIVQNLAFGPIYGRRSLNMVRGIANSVNNLNNTSSEINQRKKGPIRILLSKHIANPEVTLELESCLSNSSAYKKLRDDGIWPRIGDSIVKAYDDLSEDCNSPSFHATPIQQQVLIAYADELNTSLKRISLID